MEKSRAILEVVKIGNTIMQMVQKGRSVCVFVCLFVFMRVSLAGLGTSVPFLTQQTKLLRGRDAVIERVRLKLSAAAFKELKCYDKGLLSVNPLEDRVNETRKEKMHRSRQQQSTNEKLLSKKSAAFI